MELDLFLSAKVAKGLTYEQIGEPLGLKRPEIYTILHGTRPASLKKLLDIGGILDVPQEKTADMYKEMALEKANKKIIKSVKKNPQNT